MWRNFDKNNEDEYINKNIINYDKSKCILAQKLPCNKGLILPELSAEGGMKMEMEIEVFGPDNRIGHINQHDAMFRNN